RSKTSARSRSVRSPCGNSSRPRSARSCSTAYSRRRRRPRNSRAPRRARVRRAHDGAGRRRLPRRLEPLRDARDVSVVRRGRAPLLRVDDLPRRRRGRTPRRPLPAAPPHRSLRCRCTATRRSGRDPDRHRVRGRARRWRRGDRAARAAAGHRLPRDLDALVLRGLARGRRADDPVRAAAALGAGARAMILVSLVFLVLLVIGAPVAVAVGAAGHVGALLAAPAPLATSGQTILHQVDSFVLLSLPLFILAGALMETGGIAKRLVALAVALVGWIRGGLGMAVITAEYIFSGISGSTVADVSAVAPPTLPGLVRAGSSKELALAIVSAASAMGILVPPCILMIVIGSVASLSVAALFTAGFLPAVVLALALMVYVWWKAGKTGIASEPVPTGGGVMLALWHALIPLGMPTIIFGGILGGIMTPTEASVLAVLYAAFVGLFVYRGIKWRELPGIVGKSEMGTGAVGLLVRTAGLVSWFLTVQQLPDKLIRLMTIVPGSSLVFLFTTAVIFVFFGAVIEGLPAVVILLPSLLPVAKGLGVDPIHYAIVIVAAVGIRLFLPPIGLGLFLACGIADLSVDRATPAMMPFIAVLGVGLAVVILVPWITLVLPRLFNLL